MQRLEAIGPLKRASLGIFSGLAPSYDRALDVATMYQDRRWKEWVTVRLAQEGEPLVLDVGCGSLVLEERLDRLGYRFVGIDLSSQMLRLGARKKGPMVELLVRGDAEALPFGEAFDCVVACYVPKYVDLGLFAKELARVTRPGGAVLVYDFAMPKGVLAPLLRAYIQGGLRVLGALLGLAKSGAAATFRDLPSIIEGTTWDAELPGVMEVSGFTEVETARLTGGTVFAYWGKKGEGIKSREPVGGRR